MIFFKPKNLRVGDLVWVRFISAHHSDVGPPDAWIKIVFKVFSNGDILAYRPDSRPKYYYKDEVYAKTRGSFNKLRRKFYNSVKIKKEVV